MFQFIKIPFKVYGVTFLVGLITLLFIGNFSTTFEGLIAIFVHPSLLVTDYLEIGGLHATLINAWLMLWLSLFSLHFMKAKFSGVAFAAVWTIVGFSFFGKNPINVLPIWIGFYVYTRLTKTKLNQYVGTFLFSSGIAPSVSYLIFAGIFPFQFSIPLGLLTGVVVGFITPMVVSTVGKFHQGYNLYNTGFGIGFIAVLLTALLRVFSVPIEVEFTESYSYHLTLLLIIFVLSLILIVLPFLMNKRIVLSWRRLLLESGNLPSDFTKSQGLLPTLFNVGTIGLFSLLIIVLYDFKLSGPMVAGIITFMGFGAYGKHVVNAIPVMTGVVIASYLPSLSFMNLGPSIALFFVTAISPIAGKFGPIYGILAGFLHLVLSSHVFAFQGGFDLYNNGFTAGIVAGLIVVLAQQFPLQPARWFRFRKRH
jgi:hypothetical protein